LWLAWALLVGAEEIMTFLVHEVAHVVVEDVIEILIFWLG